MCDSLSLSLSLSLFLSHKAHLHSKRSSVSQSVSMRDYYINYCNTIEYKMMDQDKSLGQLYDV